MAGTRNPEGSKTFRGLVLGGILDAATLAELEALLDAIASGEGATNSGEWRGGAS